ncbi:MAG: hypothetical protein ACRD22_13130 [Terriglobia bacterium]
MKSVGALLYKLEPLFKLAFWFVLIRFVIVPSFTHLAGVFGKAAITKDFASCQLEATKIYPDEGVHFTAWEEAITMCMTAHGYELWWNTCPSVADCYRTTNPFDSLFHKR